MTEDLERGALHQAIVETRAKYPFYQDVMVLLPDGAANLTGKRFYRKNGCGRIDDCGRMNPMVDFGKHILRPNDNENVILIVKNECGIDTEIE